MNINSDQHIEVQVWQQKYDHLYRNLPFGVPYVSVIKTDNLNDTHVLTASYVSTVSLLFAERDRAETYKRSEVERRVCHHAKQRLVREGKDSIISGDLYLIMCNTTCVGLNLYLETDDGITLLK